MTDKLKPCPFCGSHNVGVFHYKAALRDSFACNCYNCHVGMYPVETEEQAIEDWNTRKPMDRIVEQIEEMFNVDPIYYGKEAKWAVDRAIEIVKAGGKND